MPPIRRNGGRRKVCRILRSVQLSQGPQSTWGPHESSGALYFMSIPSLPPPCFDMLESESVQFGFLIPWWLESQPTALNVFRSWSTKPLYCLYHSFVVEPLSSWYSQQKSCTHDFFLLLRTSLLLLKPWRTTINIKTKPEWLAECTACLHGMMLMTGHTSLAWPKLERLLSYVPLDFQLDSHCMPFVFRTKLIPSSAPLK